VSKPVTAKRRDELKQLFTDACSKYLRLYGIKAYHFTFEVCDLTAARAQVAYNTAGSRYATFRIDEQQTDESVDYLAQHEVLELLLGRLGCMAADDNSEDKVNAELHKVIYTLQNVDGGL
jgi:hypothetical protein